MKKRKKKEEEVTSFTNHKSSEGELASQLS
jgi:hypothetical protein